MHLLSHVYIFMVIESLEATTGGAYPPSLFLPPLTILSLWYMKLTVLIHEWSSSWSSTAFLNCVARLSLHWPQCSRISTSNAQFKKAVENHWDDLQLPFWKFLYISMMTTIYAPSFSFNSANSTHGRHCGVRYIGSIAADMVLWLCR